MRELMFNSTLAQRTKINLTIKKETSMHRRVVLALGLLLCVPAIAQAASSIVVGNHVLLQETAGQTIQLNVTGNDSIGALDLFMTINGGTGPAPVVTAVDITGAGTIFFGNNTGLGLFGGATNPPSLIPAVATTTASGFVISNGLLATVTFDTTGVPAGVYSWSLTGHPDFGDTDFGTDENFDFIYPTVTNGTLTIVPEPASVVMGLFAAAGVGVVAIRKRRARRA
jgi:hypothetical protein